MAGTTWRCARGFEQDPSGLVDPRRPGPISPAIPGEQLHPGTRQPFACEMKSGLCARAVALVHVPSLTPGWLCHEKRGLSEGLGCRVASCRCRVLEGRPYDTEAKSVIHGELLPGPADGRLARAIPWKPPERTNSRRRRPGRRTVPGADGRKDYAGCARIPDRTEQRHALAGDP